MKVLILNCHKEDNDDINRILDPFIKGIEESGAEVEQIDTRSLEISPCRGCTSSISFKSDGHCFCEDDMNSLYPKFRESDIWVFTSSDDGNCNNPKLMNIMDRMEPLFPKTFEDDTDMKGKIAFISTTKSNTGEKIQTVADEFMSISALFNKEYAGALLRPQASSIKVVQNLGGNIDDIFQAAKDAGKQIILNGKIESNTIKTFERSLFDDKKLLEVLASKV